VPELMRRALSKETDGRPLVVCLDLNPRTAQERSFEEWTKVRHEKVPAEHRAEATGEPTPSRQSSSPNYSWDWDSQNPAGSPIQIATVSYSAQASLPPNESICSPKRAYGPGRPLRRAVGGARPPLPLVCSCWRSSRRPPTNFCVRVDSTLRAETCQLGL
jgi:hypothetical protein